jgi:DnaJ-class molecular chaperone
MENYYDILNLPENCSEADIKKSYRKLSLIHHPDKNGGDSSKFQKISEAYETLSDPENRKKYDLSRQNPFGANLGPGGNGPVDVDQIFKMFFGGNMPGMHGMHGMPGMAFGGFPGGMNGTNIKVFRNGQPVNMNALNKPTPIIKNITISLEQAYNGDSIPISIERWLIEDGMRKIENETLYIQIPKGLDDKEIIILREKGNMLDNNIKGDVKVIVSIENNTYFKREGLNLLLEKEITLKEALCGFDFIINHISGKQLRFNSEIGNIMKDGLMKNIPNFGMERDDFKGNLILKFKVVYPDKLTSDQVDKLKEIL